MSFQSLWRVTARAAGARRGRDLASFEQMTPNSLNSSSMACYNSNIIALTSSALFPSPTKPTLSPPLLLLLPSLQNMTAHFLCVWKVITILKYTVVYYHSEHDVSNHPLQLIAFSLIISFPLVAPAASRQHVLKVTHAPHAFPRVLAGLRERGVP